MKDWQRIYLRAAGAAAGIVVLAGIALFVYWYSLKPKSWDTKTISSVSANAGTFYQFETDDRVKIAGFSLKFVLANNTDRDYTLPLDVKMFERQAGTEALEDFKGKLEHPVLIPAHDRAQATISLNYSCQQFDADGQYQSERDEVTCFNDALGNVSGFVVLDEGGTR